MVNGPSKPSRVRHSSYRRRPPASRRAVWGLGGSSPAAILSSIGLVSQLVALDRLEERAEVPRPEPLIALALDDLEEEGPRLGIVLAARRLLQEDLQQVLPSGAAGDEDLELAQHVDRFIDPTHADAFQPLRQRAVVRPRRRHE